MALYGPCMRGYDFLAYVFDALLHAVQEIFVCYLALDSITEQLKYKYCYIRLILYLAKAYGR